MSALDSFIIHKVGIEALVAEIQAMTAEHFYVDPDRVHWGHVGTLGAAYEKLHQATTSMRGLAPT